MKRILLVCVLMLLIVGGTAAADPQVDKIEMMSGETYTLTYDSEVTSASANGPISISDTSGNEVTVSVNDVTGTNTADIEVQTSSGLQSTSITVHGDPDTDNQGGQAEQYQNLQDQWVNQRINTVETAEGTLRVYEQRDPTKGDIDPETGLPEGEWVRVDVNENGEPQWIYDSVQGALVYQAQQANTRYSQRTTWIIGSISIVVISWVVQFVVLPRYRRKQEENFLFGDT